jgi:hypothetical protein
VAVVPGTPTVNRVPSESMGGDQDVVDFDTWQQLAGEMAALPLLFNAPLSERHAAWLIDDLHRHEKCRILDLGCGWGELLLRALSTMPGAIGVGVDHDLAAVSRARVAAAEQIRPQDRPDARHTRPRAAQPRCPSASRDRALLSAGRQHGHEHVRRVKMLAWSLGRYPPVVTPNAKGAPT